MISDNELIKRLKDAIQSKAGIDDIEKTIGVSPLINTCKKEDRLKINYADFDADPDDPDAYCDIKVAKEVAYWKTEHPKLAKITGLCWYENGDIRLFKAIVLTP